MAIRFAIFSEEPAAMYRRRERRKISFLNSLTRFSCAEGRLCGKKPTLTRPEEGSQECIIIIRERRTPRTKKIERLPEVESTFK